MDIVLVILLWLVVGKAIWKGFWHSHDDWKPDK